MFAVRPRGSGVRRVGGISGTYFPPPVRAVEIPKPHAEVGLTVHPEKTRIVYCKDGKRRGDHEHISLTFLGYTFRARKAINSKTGETFTRTINYYGRFYRSEMVSLLRRVNFYLKRWATAKYKRLRTFKRFKRWWDGLLQRAPGLFIHWRTVRTY